MSDQTPIPPGEDQGLDATFSITEVAAAFDLDPNTVSTAVRRELGRTEAANLSSSDAQHLVEVLLADRPLADRQAALMRLGAFTPRSDVEWGLGDTAPGEESDRLAASANIPDDKLASKQSSFDPAAQDTR